jgi:phage terminase large subunit
LGRADKTAIWFVQIIPFGFAVIDYYEKSGKSLDHFIRELQTRGYIYGDCWLPHDAENELLASRLTVAQQLRDANFKVKMVKNIKVSEGINAARMIFDRCYFDRTKTEEGLDALRNYKYMWNEDKQEFTRDPLHDWASHGADAWRYVAVAINDAGNKPEKKEIPKRMKHHSHGWMA